MAELAIGQKWKDATRALEDQESVQMGKLPVCPGEAGEPSGRAIRDLKLSYVPKHQALAATYLPQYAPLIAQLKAAVGPEIAHGDDAVASWNQLEGANMKQMMAASASGAEGAAIQDVATVFGFIQDASRIAAEPLLRRADIERGFKDAYGCYGRAIQ